MSAVKKDQSPKLRIKLKSYDVRMLESSVSKVVGLLVKSGAQIKGPIPLPKKRKVYTVLRSNFKFKKSREQFERISYTRVVDVVESGSKTMEYLQNLSIPVGVLVDVKVF
ncbi:MAG: 30S ribosomal protein S10 [candidate division SR1 bacterium]|jgi:ribosomal protein S10|nr:30S ribosomal protein S10 [candidate division SR1 bacterium]MBB1578494.1 30S ribosomal protein S10 [candidate division SR1 bacterium]